MANVAVAKGASADNERNSVLDELGEIWIRLLARGLPEQTASLLDYDLTLQQCRAFAFVLSCGEASVNKVAEALGIKPSVATGITQRLVERGLIERREDPRDRRVRLLAVTERGFALVNEFRDIIQSKACEFLDYLSDDELADMRDLFAAIESRLGGNGGQPTSG